MSMVTCLQHSNPRFLQVRDDFLAICDGDEAGAKILRILEGWTNFKRSQGEGPCVWMSCQQFIKESYYTLGEKSVYRALKMLVEREYIRRITNPRDPYGAPGYLLNLASIQRGLDEQARAELLAKNDLEEDPNYPELTILKDKVDNILQASLDIPEEIVYGMEGVGENAEGVSENAEGVGENAEGDRQICRHTKNPNTLSNTLPKMGFAAAATNEIDEGTKTAIGLAAILRLPLTSELVRLVEEYGKTPDLSLMSEADAAREWIADPQRNRKQQPMSLGFFRRWIKREIEDLRRREVAREQTKTGAAAQSAAPVSPSREAVALAMYPDGLQLSREYEQLKAELRLKRQQQIDKESENHAN